MPRKAGQITRNTLSLLASDAVNRATTFVLYALVARHVGVFEFGQMSLALTFFYTFQVLAAAGLKTPVTRIVARDTGKTDEYLVNGSVVVAASSLLSVAFLLMFVRVMNYSANTASMIVMLSLGLPFYAFTVVCEAIFQARERMHLIAYANVPVNLGRIGLALVLLMNGYGAYAIIMLLMASYVAVAALEWGLMLRYITRPHPTFAPHLCSSMVRSMAPFLGVETIVALTSSLTVILLSKLASESEVALYSAAAQITVPATLVYQSILLSVFPLMCRRFDGSRESLTTVTERLIGILSSLAVPIVLGLYFLADSTLLFLYGNKEFLRASAALRVLAWTLMFTALTSVLGQVLVASLREKITLRIVAIDAIVTLLAGLILIEHFGLGGAALAALLTKAVDFTQHYVSASRLISRLALHKAIWKPAVAGACIAVYLASVESQTLLLTVLVSGILYILILASLLMVERRASAAMA